MKFQSLMAFLLLSSSTVALAKKSPKPEPLPSSFLKRDIFPGQAFSGAAAEAAHARIRDVMQKCGLKTAQSLYTQIFQTQAETLLATSFAEVSPIIQGFNGGRVLGIVLGGTFAPPELDTNGFPLSLLEIDNTDKTNLLNLGHSNIAPEETILFLNAPQTNCEAYVRFTGDDRAAMAFYVRLSSDPGCGNYKRAHLIPDHSSASVGSTEEPTGIGALYFQLKTHTARISRNDALNTFERKLVVDDLSAITFEVKGQPSGARTLNLFDSQNKINNPTQIQLNEVEYNDCVQTGLSAL